MQCGMKIGERYTFTLFLPTRLPRRFDAVLVMPPEMYLAKGGSGAPEMTVLQSKDVLVSTLRQTLSALS